jgi:hypothetical protein
VRRNPESMFVVVVQWVVTVCLPICRLNEEDWRSPSRPGVLISGFCEVWLVGRSIQLVPLVPF